jgi:3-keto-5-aminohexanoate cleavage enzyme
VSFQCAKDLNTPEIGSAVAQDHGVASGAIEMSTAATIARDSGTMAAMTVTPHPTTLITVAPTGAETAKADFPALPTTLDELVDTAERCEAVGAAMIHLHIRDADHRPTLELGRLRDAVDAVREHTTLVVQLSTGGSVHDPLDDRLKVLDAEPDSCSLTMGTTNFGDDVFLNPWPFVTQLYQQTQDREVVPEFELFDLGHVASLHRLLDTYGLPFGERVHCDLVMGVPGGMPGTADALVAAVQALPAETTSWSATGIGRTTLAVALASLSKGGHLRVGMEDTLSLARGVPVTHNAELVSRAASLCELAQRPAMSTADARELLQVKRR